MKIVTGIRFRRPGKIYYFDKGDLQLEKGMHVIVDTSKGDEYGEVVIPEKKCWWSRSIWTFEKDY